METQGLNVSLIKSFLHELRSGRLYVVKVARGGPRGRYAYLNVPKEVAGSLNAKRFNVIAGEGYIDYVVDEKGEYKLTESNRGFKIRFPIDVDGYVIVEPRPNGFRVYF